jgi:hypothetical protein
MTPPNAKCKRRDAIKQETKKEEERQPKGPTQIQREIKKEGNICKDGHESARQITKLTHTHQRLTHTHQRLVAR